MEIILWVIAAISKIGYILWYKTRNRKWNKIDTILAFIINLVFYGIGFDLLNKIL